MLEVLNISKKFNKVYAVNDVSFKINPGEILGYLGPNGAGKSTTVKILTGLLKPSSGKILYHNQDLNQNILKYQAKLGYVSENSDIYLHLSGFEYLQFVGRLREIGEEKLKKKIEELLKLFNFTTGIYNSIYTYSKGMKQKILVIASLLHNPDIYLFDEPLSGLDVNTVLIFKDVLKFLAEKGKIILYCSHMLEIVENICTRVIIIHQGKIYADDTISNLKILRNSSSLEHIFKNLLISEDTNAIARDIVQVIGD